MCAAFAVVFVLIIVLTLLCYLYGFCTGNQEDGNRQTAEQQPEDLLNVLAIITYGVPLPPPAASISFESDNCAICLADFENGDLLRVLRCKHLFHGQLYQTVAASRSLHCPALLLAKTK